jgi:hypothetical protein
VNYTEKQTFKLTYDWWEIEIEIDFGFPNVMKNITDMIYFWGDGDERLDENNGDYVTTFLKQLAIKCLWL